MSTTAYSQHARVTCWLENTSFTNSPSIQCSEELKKTTLYMRCLFKRERLVEGTGTCGFLLVYASLRIWVEGQEDILVLAVTPDTQVERGQWSLLLFHQGVMFSPTLTPLLYVSYFLQLKLCTHACWPSHWSHGAEEEGDGCLPREAESESILQAERPFAPGAVCTLSLQC